MKIHILEHKSYEGAGRIIDWAKKHKHQITTTRLHEGGTFPLYKDVDLLVVMGGPMSVHDEDEHPWLPDEKHFMRNVIHRGTKVLGICLGAQLAAECIGGKVSKNKVKEIGWLPIKAVEKHPLTKNLPSPLTVFHWHGETFTLPKYTTHLWQSKACTNQGFLWNDQVLGLQFHMEVDEPTLTGFQPHIEKEAKKATATIQPWAKIEKEQAKHLKTLGPLLFKLLDNFIKLDTNPMIDS